MSDQAFYMASNRTNREALFQQATMAAVKGDDVMWHEHPKGEPCGSGCKVLEVIDGSTE